MSRLIRRLTFVTDAPHFGGAERYIVASAHAARRRGIEPNIYWMRLPDGDENVFDPAEKSDLTVTAIDPAHTQSVRSMSREFLAMLRRDKPDGLVVNACGRRRFWILPWLARCADIPAVWVQQMVDACDHRRLPPKQFGHRLEGLQCWRIPQALRHRLAATAATAVVALNAADRERIIRWQGVPRNKIRVIPHGVDYRQFQFDPAGRTRWHEAWGISPETATQPLVVGTAARLSHEKGVDLLIEATAICHRNGLPILAVVAGQGTARDELVALAKRRNIAHVVKFIDFTDDMPALYSALDIFALTSRTESFGLALAEAMACERSVVATPTAGSMRQIDHQHNGWQLTGLAPSELADAIAALACDPSRRQQIGRQARECVIRQFSSDLTLERTLRALRGSARERSRLRWPGMNNPAFASMLAEDLA